MAHRSNATVVNGRYCHGQYMANINRRQIGNTRPTADISDDDDISLYPSISMNHNDFYP